MIFASDLDHTLIYSNGSAETAVDQLIPVEWYDGKELTYMSERALDLLKEVTSTLTFIPVTTRTIEQYKRIEVFQNRLIPKFAITSNGGNILVDGVVNVEWKEIVAQKCKESSLSLKEILFKFNDLRGDWIIRERIADELFSYFIFNQETIPYDKVFKFNEWLMTQGWIGSLQGRKLYIVPQHINKWDPIKFLKDKLNKTFIIAAGDSKLDLCMLQVADYALSPKHGEITPTDNEVFRTTKSGVFASEEILERVLTIKN